MSLRNELLELVNTEHTNIMDLYDRHYEHDYSVIVENIPALDAALDASIDAVLKEAYMRLTTNLVLRFVEPSKQQQAWAAIRDALGVEPETGEEHV